MNFGRRQEPGTTSAREAVMDDRLPAPRAPIGRAVLVSTVLVLGSSALLAGDLRIEVDLKTRMLSAYAGPDVVKTYSVAVGTPQDPTPTGSFQIRKLVWNPSWVPPKEKWARGKQPRRPGDPENPMQRVKIFFKEPDYYIHGTPAVDSMGSAQSHGCVRMTPGEVTELAKLVMEHGGKPMPEPWYRRIFRRRSTSVVVLSEPVAMRVTD
jgi:lipoprotein-anchoring transpeptidase ErfK/SrfK